MYGFIVLAWLDRAMKQTTGIHKMKTLKVIRIPELETMPWIPHVLYVQEVVTHFI